MKLFESEDDVPDEEAARRFIRMFCGDDVLVTSGTRGKNNNHLHIPDTNPFVDNRPLCATGVDIDWIRKSQSVYPMGFKPFCRRCLARAFPEQAAVNIPEVDR